MELDFTVSSRCEDLQWKTHSSGTRAALLVISTEGLPGVRQYSSVELLEIRVSVWVKAVVW